uniref:Uncharacterized protein n=1 Tax=Haptolina ericina TaxID=156174 RepID=A0A7S3C7I6_9EUKA
MKKRTVTPNTLKQHPTVAISDAFNAAGHLCAAQLVWHIDKPAAFGFIIVAVAASVGVLRFGLSEGLFAKANEDLAALAGFLGLPLVGLSFAKKWLALQIPCEQQIGFVVACAIVCALAGSLPPKAKELALVVFNFFFFLLPVGGFSYANHDLQTGASIGLFAFAGIVVGADRYSYMLNIRRENIFHYLIAAASYGMSFGLVDR